jgi:hypothetical protein
MEASCLFVHVCYPKQEGLPGVLRNKGTRHILQQKKSERIRKHVSLENKGTCRFREQGNMLKYVLGTKEQRETFEVNTGAETPSETLKEDIRTTQMFFLNFMLNLTNLLSTSRCSQLRPKIED